MGRVKVVVPVAVNVMEYAPEVANVPPLAIVNVALVAGAVIATLLIDVADAIPNVGVVNEGEANRAIALSMYVAPITDPCHVPLLIVPTVVMLDDPAAGA